MTLSIHPLRSRVKNQGKPVYETVRFSRFVSRAGPSSTMLQGSPHSFATLKAGSIPLPVGSSLYTCRRGAPGRACRAGGWVGGGGGACLLPVPSAGGRPERAGDKLPLPAAPPPPALRLLTFEEMCITMGPVGEGTEPSGPWAIPSHSSNAAAPPRRGDYRGVRSPTSPPHSRPGRNKTLRQALRRTGPFSRPLSRRLRFPDRARWAGSGSHP